MGRAPCCAKVGLNKGSWTHEEDMKLIVYIQKYGHANWRALPKKAGLLRCGKSCRLRWINYLSPNTKRGNFTKEEEDTIIRLHNSLGNKWSKIASCLPGRTDNEIKNVWNTYLKKKLSSKKVQETSEETLSPSSSVTTNLVSNRCSVKHDNENTSKNMTNTLVHAQPSDDLADFLEMKSVMSPLNIEPYLDDNNIWEMEDLDMMNIPLITSPCSTSMEELQVDPKRILLEEKCKGPLEMQEFGVGQETYWNIDDHFELDINWLENLERELGLLEEKEDQEGPLCEMEGDPVLSYFQDESHCFLSQT